jgi:CAAX protease family protein
MSGRHFGENFAMDDLSPVPSNLAPPGAPVPASQPSTIRSIFLGPSGIRAGWRSLMYLAMMVIIAVALVFLFQQQHHSRLWNFFFGELFGVIAVLVPAFAMGRVEKRPFGAYGLPAEGAFGRLFWNGALWGLAAITLLLVSIRSLHGFYFGHLALHGVRILKFALFWGAVFLLVGFFEEFLFRGYTQFTLTTGIGFWPAAALLSFGFGALHLNNKGESILGGLAAGLIGFFFCLTLRRTGNLWFAVGFHMSFDWGETFLYSVPNSGTVEAGHLLNSSFQGPRWLTGGTVGPEGSVFVFVLIAILWIAFDRMYRDIRYGAN